jgi:hypothetical protein
VQIQNDAKIFFQIRRTSGEILMRYLNDSFIDTNLTLHHQSIFSR